MVFWKKNKEIKHVTVEFKLTDNVSLQDALECLVANVIDRQEKIKSLQSKINFSHYLHNVWGVSWLGFVVYVIIKDIFFK